MGTWDKKLQDACFQICEARASFKLKLLFRGLHIFCWLQAQFLAVFFLSTDEEAGPVSSPRHP